MYFGEQKHSISRKPDPEKDRLAEQNALLRRLLRQQQELAARRKNNPKLWLTAGIVSAVLVVATTSFCILHIVKDHSKNSITAADVTAITGQAVSGFTPYFFADGNPPDSYTVVKAQSTFDSGILQVTLLKPGGSPVVLTEQALPSDLSSSTLLNNNTMVKGAAGPAGVNTVEGRVVGTMLPSAHSTLVLINAAGTVKTSNVSDLLKALLPVQN